MDFKQVGVEDLVNGEEPETVKCQSSVDLKHDWLFVMETEDWKTENSEKEYLALAEELKAKWTEICEDVPMIWPYKKFGSLYQCANCGEHKSVY